jgi:hypothetical protein
VTGKYFNRIIGDLKRFNRGRVLSEVISWMEKVHGYLSSPSGGGVRHGAVLSDSYELTEGEARLFCDLTRSYLSYLLHEHQRLGHQIDRRFLPHRDRPEHKPRRPSRLLEDGMETV